MTSLPIIENRYYFKFTKIKNNSAYFVCDKITEFRKDTAYTSYTETKDTYSYDFLSKAYYYHQIEDRFDIRYKSKINDRIVKENGILYKNIIIITNEEEFKKAMLEYIKGDEKK